jgi:hypothetical protein
MPTSIENIATEYGVTHRLSEDQMARVEVRALELRKAYEPHADSLADLAAKPSIVNELFSQAHLDIAAQDEAREGVENVLTQFASKNELSEADIKAVAERALKLRKRHEPEAKDFGDLTATPQERSIIDQWLNIALREKRADDETKPAITPFQIKEAALLEKIAQGGSVGLTAQRDLIRFYQDELQLSPAAAGQAANSKLAEFGGKLGNDKPLPGFKLAKPIRKALKAAATDGLIERAPKLPRPDKPKDMIRAGTNPYFLPLNDPARQAKIVSLMSMPSLARNLASAAGCRLDGRKLNA